MNGLEITWKLKENFLSDYFKARFLHASKTTLHIDQVFKSVDFS